jgi:hypothetical protein
VPQGFFEIQAFFASRATSYLPQRCLSQILRITHSFLDGSTLERGARRTVRVMSGKTQNGEEECTELLQTLIRNACVNDGTVESGGEIRSASVLENFLEGPGLELESYDAAPGRRSLVARIEGSDPTAPTLLLMGHTDVVPANPDHWSRDPFGGDLVDGEVWGRGAIDMLNITSSMAVAFKRLARSGFTPRGTLVYLAVADEESNGVYGADYLINHERDAVMADYVITESGGIPLPSPNGLKLPVLVGEKGLFGIRIRVGGTAGMARSPIRPTTHCSLLRRSFGVSVSSSPKRTFTTSGDVSSSRWDIPKRSRDRCFRKMDSTTSSSIFLLAWPGSSTHARTRPLRPR